MAKPKTKKEAKPVKNEKNIPAWFNKEQDIVETTREEVEELDKILTELI